MRLYGPFFLALAHILACGGSIPSTPNPVELDAADATPIPTYDAAPMPSDASTTTASDAWTTASDAWITAPEGCESIGALPCLMGDSGVMGHPLLCTTPPEGCTVSDSIKGAYCCPSPVAPPLRVCSRTDVDCGGVASTSMPGALAYLCNVAPTNCAKTSYPGTYCCEEPPQ
jgi:hypothetical protein